MAINPANIGYLPGIILKEIRAGHTIELTGSVLATIRNREDYEKKKDRIIGKFGEVIQWTPTGKTFIATRDPPSWAREKIHEVIWDCPEMIRWDTPKEER